MKTTISLLILFALVLGGGYWYAERSTERALEDASSQAASPSTSMGTTASGTPTPGDNSGPGSASSGRGASGQGSGSSGGAQAGSYTLAQVAAHNTAGSCWAAIEGSVYDLTSWINQHPGGAARILSICGKDGTQVFEGQHGSDRRAQDTLASFRIGMLAR